MKVFLDDIRTPESVYYVPEGDEGWVTARTAEEAIKLLKTGTVTVISLDHDLGECVLTTGYDVVLWMEKESQSDNTNIRLPVDVRVHSSNPAGVKRMLQAIARIRYSGT